MNNFGIVVLHHFHLQDLQYFFYVFMTVFFIANVVWTKYWIWKIPVSGIILVIMLILGLIIKMETCLTRPPKFFYPFTFTSVIMSFHWIWLCSDSVINYIDTIGLSLKISSMYLGLTLLSIANSVNDFMMNLIICAETCNPPFPAHLPPLSLTCIP